MFSGRREIKFMKTFSIICWVAILIFHWAFIQNDFFNSEIDEDEPLEINFDIFFILVWLVGFVSML
jgi:hypothetical protein